MSLTVVTKVARQVEGEYVLVSVLGAFKNPEKAQEFVRSQKIEAAEVIDGVPCVVEIGVITDVQVLDEE